MIYVFSELHGDFDPLFLFARNEGKRLAKKDYVIVLGDMGCWPLKAKQLQRLKKLNFTVCFIDGNHEHYPFLNSFPTQTMFGGRVHDVFGVYHLCRGEIFLFPTERGDVRIAVCGGGDSRDKKNRTEGVDWFPEEQISESDVNNLLEKAKAFDMQVDYFLSHSLSAAVKLEWSYESSSCPFFGGSSYQVLSSDYRIRDIVGQLNAKIYFSGHEHIDREFLLDGKRYRSVYKNFVKL